ncbi:RNA polymerase sigma factor [Paraglaciecola marina]|uniref:RNA polymerase sigma factor n=1 Tax=Paraglaciecola marina TaxID=2500157 RepID=UPI0010606D63|nr:sigma-70 family RNA polymerase sigma factor [Paraglaciecola marina]
MNTSTAPSVDNEQAQLFNDVSLAQEGDQQAFARLIKQTQNLVSSIALSIVKDLDSSEDVTQQVFIGAWQNISELKNGHSFLPWLRQMTRYKALNFLRDNKVRQKIEGDEADQILAQFCDPKLAIDESMQRQQSNLILQSFIEQLPDESREIVLLYYREEQSSLQVAKLLELSEANVRKKLSRVRQLLQKQIMGKYGRLLLSTAPTAGLSGLILGAITTSSPVAAATISSVSASSKTSVVQKIGLLMGGSFIGAFFAIIAIRLSTKPLLKKATSDAAKQQILSYRRSITIWIIFSAILLTLGYELTTGWWGPVSAYCIFAVGILFHTNKMQTLIAQQTLADPSIDTKEISHQKFQALCGFWGKYLGLLLGFSGLMYGLVSSGRLSF